MLCYLKKMEDYSLDIYQNHDKISVDTTIQRYLNQRLLTCLTDVKSREQVTKRVFGYKAKTPLYINHEELLMCIRSYRSEASFYINYFSIKRYYEWNHQLIVEFAFNHALKIKQKHSFFEQLSRCRKMIDFLEF